MSVRATQCSTHSATMQQYWFLRKGKTNKKKKKNKNKNNAQPKYIIQQYAQNAFLL